MCQVVSLISDLLTVYTKTRTEVGLTWDSWDLEIALIRTRMTNFLDIPCDSDKIQVDPSRC